MPLGDGPCHVEKSVGVVIYRLGRRGLDQTASHRGRRDRRWPAFECFRRRGPPDDRLPYGRGRLLRLEHDRPDAVLLDVRLPTINGIEVLRTIRLTDRALPVILITGYASPGQLAEARQLGVTDIIAKSFILTHFADVLVRIRGRSEPD